METSKVVSAKTKLADRTLWYDGDSTFSEEKIVELISNGNSIIPGTFVDEITETIREFNRCNLQSEQLLIKEENNIPPIEWNIPDEYKSLDIENYIMQKLEDEIIDMSDDECTCRIKRVMYEIQLFKQFDFMDVLKMLTYVINTLIENDVIYGVGRGSAVSSYVLYLLEIHDVDSVKYELDVRDFLR